jgi:hypothetical protein
MRGQEPLSLPWRLETLHAPFRLPRRLVGFSCTVVEMAVFHPQENFPLGGAIAFQSIEDDQPRRIQQTRKGLWKNFLTATLSRRGGSRKFRTFSS